MSFAFDLNAFSRQSHLGAPFTPGSPASVCSGLRRRSSDASLGEEDRDASPGGPSRRLRFPRCFAPLRPVLPSSPVLEPAQGPESPPPMELAPAVKPEPLDAVDVPPLMAHSAIVEPPPVSPSAGGGADAEAALHAIMHRLNGDTCASPACWVCHPAVPRSYKLDLDHPLASYYIEQLRHHGTGIYHDALLAEMIVLRRERIEEAML